MTFNPPDPEKQSPDWQLRRMRWRIENRCKKHKAHREHQGDRRKKRARH